MAPVRDLPRSQAAAPASRFTLMDLDVALDVILLCWYPNVSHWCLGSAMVSTSCTYRQWHQAVKASGIRALNFWSELGVQDPGFLFEQGM